MFDCTTENYDEIYAPWLDRGTDLLKWSGWDPNNLDQRLLDVCGGTGAISHAAADLNPRKVIVLFDLNPRCMDPRVEQVRGDANHVDQYVDNGMFDIVICRQGIAYLKPELFFANVAKVMKPCGVLVFNTFCDPATMGWKSTDFKGKTYKEAHLSLFGHIIHAQMVAEWPPKMDIAVFKNHEFTHLWAHMSHYFDATVEFHGHSARIRATKLDKYRE